MRAAGPAARPSDHARYTAAYRLDQITDPDRLRDVGQRLLAALQASQWQQTHLVNAFTGGCLPCGLAIDAGEHPLQACAEWRRRQQLIDAGWRCV